MKLFDQLHSDKRFLPEYPSEEVIKWRWRRLNPGMKILIIGCGGGRHVVYFAQEGFNVTAIDISETGISATRQKIEKLKLQSTLISGVRANNLQLFDDESFDAILAFSVLYYQDRKEFATSITEMARVLKKNGYLFFNMRSKKDWRYSESTLIEEQYVMNELDHQGQKIIEAGISMLFLEPNEIVSITSANFSIEIGEYSSLFNSRRNDNYIFDAIKIEVEDLNFGLLSE